MRAFRIGRAITFVLALLAGGCAHPPAPPSPAIPAAPAPHGTAVHPSNIKRVVRDLPPGYEVSGGGIPTAASPRLIWGLGADAAAKPPQCGTLADPGDGRDQSAQGISGSGPGGIVDAVVVAVPELLALHGKVVAVCGQWAMTAGRTTARVHLVDPPRIDSAETLGMVADLRSSVESGTQIDSRAYTFIAYLGDYYAFTTLTTDPGSALPALPPQFAADLLVQTVLALRG
ncbi:MAG: DUF5642 family protein [Mycobacterium sp.]|nr:DUF5642 family protein [Mycobacterium sp.]